MRLKLSSGVRNLLYLGAVLVLVLLWRLAAPAITPRVRRMLGQDFVRFWEEPYFHLGSVPVTPAFLIGAFVFLVLLVIAMRIARSLARRHVLIHVPLDEGQKFAIERGVGYVIFLAGLAIGLQSAGVNLSSLLVVGGALGIGIGFGLQTIAKNFVSGLILLVERPVKVGDRVEVGQLNGDITYIGARATYIRTNDNIMVIVPNAEFVENRVTNWTAHDRRVRFSVPLGVGYGSDPEHVRRVLLETAKRHPDVLETPEPDVIFKDFGDSSLDFELRVWTIRRVQTPQILRSELYYRIFSAFRSEGIEIPFPQRDLHLRSVAQPVPVVSSER